MGKEKKLYDVRSVALETLLKIKNEEAYSNLLLRKVIQSSHLNEKDERLLTELVYGVTSRRLTLEYYLYPFIKKAKKVEGWVNELLLLSVYQLCFLDRVPSHAVVNEAVKITKHRGNIGASKFVNGVLRNFIRQGHPAIEDIKDQMKRLSIELSMPEWLVSYLVDYLGYEKTRCIGLSLFEPSKVSARVNEPFSNKVELCKHLESEGIITSPSNVSPVGIVGEKGFLAGSSSYSKGEMTLQDESSMLVAPAMMIEPSHTVLDTCAAPGGKTTHIATYLEKNEGGRVIALDIHQHKLQLIQDNATRLHVADVIEPRLLDARSVTEAFEDEFFDRILIDAPCSGLGLMRRKPDIKYNKKYEDILNLQKIQLEILESCATKIKKYGIITYSTCTITHEENQDVIETFLSKHTEFSKVPVRVNELVQQTLQDDCLVLYPDEFLTDGFFICCLQKQS